MMACEECCRNCQLAHGKKNDFSPSVSRFVKVFIGKDVSTYLLVPPLYTKTISHLVGKDAKLEDATGAQWTVSLSNYTGVLVFNKGWEKFAADHKLQLGDFLVFHYFNFGHFVVHIFDRTLTERTEFAYNIHLGKDTMTTGKIVAGTTPSQRNASNGVSSRSIDHSSRQARSGRNLINASTRSGEDNGFTDTEKSAADTTPFQGNATKGLSFTDVGLRPKQRRTSLGDGDMGATNGVGSRNVGRPHKQARTGDGDNGASKGVSSRNVDCPQQARADRNLVNPMTSLEMNCGDIRITGTSEATRESSGTSFPIESNIETPLDQPSASYGPLKPKSVNEEQPCLDVADTTPSQRNATNGVSSRSVEHHSRQEKPSRNLTNARTSLEMCDRDNGATDTEKFAVDTSPFQGNATKGVGLRCNGCPSKQERTDRNLDNAKSCLELDGGDIRMADTSEFNRESSRTSFPIESNFETPLIQPSMSYGPLQPKSGNEERPCLDDASCVIIDRSTYYAETEKKMVLSDLSVYECQNREPISDKTCIAGDEGTHTRAQKFEASMTEANNSGTGFINRMTVSKLPETGMVQDTKASGHMDTTGMVQDTKASGHTDTTSMVQDTKASGHTDTTGMVQDTKASGHMDTTGMVQNTKASGHTITTGMVQDTKASGHMNTTGNCSKSPLGRGNCSKSQLGNGFASPNPRQVNTLDTRKGIKVVKKEQVTLREEARDHLQKPQDLNSSWYWEPDGPPTSLKRKAAKLELEDSLDEPALFPDSITCLAVTDNCDYIKLPARLPSVAFKRVRGKIDNRCSILLIDPEKRKWPAIYFDKFGSFFGVICGWKQFNEANNVQPGDSYVFSLDNKSECWFKVDVVRT